MVGDQREDPCPVTGQTQTNLDELFLGIRTEELPPAGQTAEQQAGAKSNWERWQPKQLNSRHREIMRRILEGCNLGEIAAAVGISGVAMSLIVTSKLFREELAKLEAKRDDSVLARAESLSNEALDVLKLQMRMARSESIRNRAANDILGIGGYSKIEKKLIGVVNAEEVIKELNRQRRDSAKLVGEEE